jgi:hypothetical protein
MTSPLGPRNGGIGVKLEMGICRVKKTCRLYRLTLVSLLMSTRNGLASGGGVDFGWSVSSMIGGIGCSTRVSNRLELARTRRASSPRRWMALMWNSSFRRQ